MAKGKKTGGRQKGARNKGFGLSVREILEAHNFDPIEEMIKLYPSLDPSLQVKVNSELASYAHPKLKALEHTGNLSVTLESLVAGAQDKPE